MAEGSVEKENRKPMLVPFSEREVQEALRREDPFALISVTYKRTPEGHLVVIHNEGTLLATTRQGRKELESRKESWRWAAGGALLVVQCKDRTVGLVRHRDSDAPSYGDHWTLGSGLSSPASAKNEFRNPSALAVREGVEEFIIVTPDGIVRPTFDNSHLTDVAEVAVESIVNHAREDAAFSEKLRTDKRVKVRAEFQRALGEENLEVLWENWRGYENYEDVTTNQQGIIVVDEKTRGIDFLKVVRLDLSQYRLDELSFIDGELNAENKSHNNPVGCLEVVDTHDLKGRLASSRLSRNLVRVFQSGKAQDASQYSFEKMTPVLSGVSKALEQQPDTAR